MTDRRSILAFAIGGGAALLGSAPAAAATADCPQAAAQAVGGALLDRYAAAVNAHDTGAFPELFAESYIQHSGRSPSGLAAQIDNFRRIHAAMPDLQMRIEDRIIAGDKVVARNTWSATHTQPLRGIAPTGKPFTFRTIDIWRVEGGKFAEHWDLTDTEEVVRRLPGD
jgi:steroid delta-isomerase-like uncharacterized protein